LTHRFYAKKKNSKQIEIRNMESIIVTECGAPEVLVIHQVDIPKPGPNEVLIRVESVGVNPVDTYIRNGGHQLSKVPYTPGKDCSGVITEVGENVNQFKVDDRVWTSSSRTGVYAQYSVIPMTDVHLLPEHVSFDEGAGLFVPYGTAYHGIYHRGNVESGNTVLIHGASGGVGIALLQLLVRIPDVVIIGTAGTDEGLELVKNNGAHRTFNHRQEGYMAKILESTGGKGIDVIFEMLANVNLSEDLKIMSMRGRTVVIGSRGPIQIAPRELMMKRSDIRGLALGTIDEEEKREIIEAIQSGLQEGYLKPIIWKIYSLHDAPKSHHEIINTESGAKGKIILKPWI